MAKANETKTPKTDLQRALKAARSTFATVGVFSLFINLLMLTAPLYMLQIYDRVLSSKSESTLVMLTIVAGGLLLVLGLLEVVRSRVLVRVGTKLDQQLSNRVFSAIFSYNLKKAGQGSSQSLRDLDTLRQFLTGSGLNAFFDAPWTPLFIAVIFLFHPLLGFVALGGAIAIFILALLNELITRKPLSEANQENVQANKFADASLRNSEVLAAMGMTPGLRQRWADRHENTLALQAVASDRAGTITATSKAFRLMLQVAILGTGAYLAIQQIITPGVMIAASIIMARALAPVEQAIGSWRQFIGARSAYGRLQELLAAIPEQEERMPLPAPEGRLETEKVVATPPGSKQVVLKGVSFALEPGESLGIIGPSAAGKSSLARLLIGVWPPASGHVRLDGADIYDWDHTELGPYLGYLPQDVELFDGTVSENIARFQEPDPDKVVAAAKKADVHEIILGLPDGYDTLIGNDGASLSGGQRQRVGLARALYGDPRLIVLDEPNANLDSAGETALRQALDTLKAEGRTTVVISHKPSLLSVVDKMLVLKNGQAEQFGERQEVMSRFTRPVAGQEAQPDASNVSSMPQTR